MFFPMIHTFPWIPPGVMGGKTISLGGVIKLDIQVVFQGPQKVPWNLEFHEVVRLVKKSWRNTPIISIYGSTCHQPNSTALYTHYMWLVATQRCFFKFSPRMFGEDFVPIWRAGIFFQMGWLKPPTMSYNDPLAAMANVGRLAWCHPNPLFLLWEVFLFFVILLALRILDPPMEGFEPV